MMKIKSASQLTDEQFKDMVLLILSELLNLHHKTHKTHPEYYDSADVKQLLKISDRTLQRLRKSGEIPHIRIGRKIFYPRSFFTEAARDLRKE
ncbi:MULTISPECIES: helix-turn-helix domain-containing protein [Chryseobacterium]|uniref:Helix-turn-helix domain n=1 Tax=Chryseobacterium taihuense TaxID=1141221 RepID=A0A4U8W8P6_9FLAO|nr:MULTISPECIES: helix-turn-helix domain-containing protein [Chryseobacterium]QQV04133.1 helix-turn-helix domain-containing protein [Chryseobacterium sp. FDAARGOS 1104]VFB02502.1 Helix-turn-helix domain [Chryseobacterium taihuense]